MRTAIKLIGTALALSAVPLAVAAFSNPNTPSSLPQWCWLFALALPMYLAGEFMGHLLWNNRMTRAVARQTAAKSFSLLRIVYGVLLFLAFASLLLGAAWGWQLLRPLIDIG